MLSSIFQYYAASGSSNTGRIFDMQAGGKLSVWV
jgi:hypothetical protein